MTSNQSRADGFSPSVIYHDDNYPGWGAPGNGVMMAEGWINATYNALNQPVSISSAVSGGPMWFGYDPLGRCVKRWVGPLMNGGYPPPETNPATYFLYDGWNMIAEGPGGGGVTRVYAHGAGVDEIIASSNEFGAVLFHHYNALGNCILLSDGAGNLSEQYDYEAFGKPYFYNTIGTNIPSLPWKNRYLGKGREWLSDLKLYDYRHRLYQPELGRFLQPDPKHFAAGDYNLYRYCHNDPVNKSDPMGLAPGDPFTSVEDAVRDLHSFINPTSIQQNAEYGSVLYQRGDQFYASKPFTDGAGTKVVVGAPTDHSRVPEGGKRIGDYHTHGDYSKPGRKDLTTGKAIPQRATGPNAKRDDATGRI